VLELIKFLLLILLFENNAIFDEFAPTSLYVISFFIAFRMICSNVLLLQVNFMLQESEN
jgi:hypothetical protein